MQAPKTQAYHPFYALEQPRGIDKSGLVEGLAREVHGQNDLEIVGLVQGVLVVLLMTGPEIDVVEPAEEAEDA